MITLANYFSGQTIRIISFLILQFSSSLKLQFTFIKQTVAKSNSQSKKIPDCLTNALIAIEDRRFFQHKGIDIYSIIRALYKNITTKRLEGASTISQQLVRNITNEREIKVKRKMKEIVFASLLEGDFSKNEILLAYYDTYRFKNCIGIFEFCKNENYNLDDISVKWAAEIAARFKYPILQKTNYSKYLRRVRTIEIKISTTNDSAST